jgi:hypothetical protein
MTISHTDVIAKLDGRPMSSYPAVVAKLHGFSLPPEPTPPTEAEWKAWRDRVWRIDNIDADAAKPR